MVLLSFQNRCHDVSRTLCDKNIRAIFSEQHGTMFKK